MALPAHQASRAQHRQQERNGRLTRRRVPEEIAVSSDLPRPVGHPAQAMIYDITPPITDRLKVWPGDTPPTREVLCDLRRGDNLTLSTLRTTVHLGCHADAPSHYGADAPAIHERSLDLYCGPCEVVRVPAARGTRITPDQLPRPIHSERVLIATGTYPDPEHFNEDFAALAPD